MEFQRRKIRKNLKRLNEIKNSFEKGEPFLPKKKLKITIKTPIIISLAIILLLVIGTVKALSHINLNVILKMAGEELLHDNLNHTNILVLGVGGENHDGGDLTDTIIVASIDNDNDLVTMLSIPRDLYVEDDIVGDSKINEIAFNATNHFGNSKDGIEHLKSKIEGIVGVPIHYWVKIDFAGFKDLVDALGGIDVDVPEGIYDPYYPKDGTYEYETFSISKGPNHLDGETALKYARSRKTTSDFDRAERQQQIIFAIKQKALSTKTILDTEKIKNLLNALKNNIETNIKVNEIITFGSIASEFGEGSILHRLIHDDPGQCGGLLYTPMRQYYYGMFVLIPAGGFDYIHLYADLNFNHQLISKENPTIHILNSTKTPGVAAETKQVLRRFCFDINRFGNGNNKDLKETTYYYKPLVDEEGKPTDEKPVSLDFLQKIIPGKATDIIPEEYKEYMQEADILLDIGQDYVNSDKYIEDPYYYLPMVTPTPTSEEAGETTEETTNELPPTES